LGKPNFNFQKRQRELAKKKKNEEKKRRKLEKNAGPTVEDRQEAAEAGVDGNDGQENGGDMNSNAPEGDEAH
jgi:hypothetical protein